MPSAHVHRLADTVPVEAGGDPVSAPTPADVERRHRGVGAKPTAAFDGFYRNGEGDEVIYVHRGRGVLRTVFGRVPFRERDYLVIPRGTTHSWELPDGEEQYWLCFHTPGEIETPNRYRNRYGQLLEHAPFSQRDFHPPAELETRDEVGEYPVTVRVRDGFQEYVLDRHPFDVVGWDGYVWPYTFNADDFEPRAGRFHLPPPAHQTFQGQNFVICTFAPRMLDWDPEAIVAALPPLEHPVRRGDVLRGGRLRGAQGRRRGQHHAAPLGLPHGPQPGAVEKALGQELDDELAVMWDTFRPLRLAALWRDSTSRSTPLLEPRPRRDPGDRGSHADSDTVVTGPSARRGRAPRRIPQAEATGVHRPSGSPGRCWRRPAGAAMSH